MGSLFASGILQFGPNGGLGMFQRWYWVFLLIPLFVVMILLYRFFLPDLGKVKVTDNLGDIAVKKVEEISGASSPSNDPINVALRLLESDERRVVDALIAAGGTLLQKEISWKTGFSRVKTHRILVRLIQRDVVTSEKYYNTNKITLSEWLHDYV